MMYPIRSDMHVLEFPPQNSMNHAAFPTNGSVNGNTQTPCLYHIKCSNIEYVQHAPIVKTCTPVGTSCEVALERASPMHVEYEHPRMSVSTVICKTQGMANIQHQLVARSDVQVKLHKTLQNRWGAVYAAFNVAPLVLLSIRRRSPSDR